MHLYLGRCIFLNLFCMIFSKSNIFFLMCVYNVYKCMRGTMYIYEVRTDIITVQVGGRLCE